MKQVDISFDEINNKGQVFLKRIVLLFVLAAMCIVSAMSLGVRAYGAEDKDADEISFYKVASAAASYFDACNSDEKKIADEYKGKNARFANAGGFVGFRDEDFEKGVFGATISRLSSASQSRGYDSFPGNAGIKQYVEYGHALCQLGLDSTSNRTFDIMAILRQLLGLIMLLFYTLAIMVDVVFSAALDVLKAFNPFSWLWEGLGKFDKFFDAGQSTSTLPSISAYLRGIFVPLQNMGLFLTSVIFFFGIAFSLLLWKKTQSVSSKFVTFMKRMAFIVIGIPFLGGMYTATLTQLDVSGMNTASANAIVASTFIDFESWAKNGRLNLPKDYQIVVDTANNGAAGSIDYSQTPTARSLAFKVNFNSTDVAGKGGSKNVFLEKSASNTQRNAKQVAAGYDMINRYRTSAFYGPADYETFYRASIGSVDDKKKVAKAIKDASDAKKYEDTDWLNLDNDGDSKDISNFVTNGNSGFTSSGDKGKITYTGSGHVSLSAKGSNDKGLSTLAMYNYLTSEFSDSSVTTYSSRKSTSGLVVTAHHSVNLVGAGVLSALYYCNALTCLAVLAVIGLSYAIGMLVNNIFRMFKIISQLPFAMLGVFKSITQVIGWAIVMTVETVGTIVLYRLVSTVFFAFNNMFDTQLSTELADKASEFSSITPGIFMASNGQSQAVTLVSVLVITILDIFFLLKALRLRKLFLKTIDATLASLVDRLFNSNGASSVAATKSATEKAGDIARAGAGMALGAAGTAMMLTPGGAAAKLGMVLGNGAKAAKVAEAADAAQKGLALATGGIEDGDKQKLPGEDGGAGGSGASGKSGKDGLAGIVAGDPNDPNSPLNGGDAKTLPIGTSEDEAGTDESTAERNKRALNADDSLKDSAPGTKRSGADATTKLDANGQPVADGTRDVQGSAEPDRVDADEIQVVDQSAGQQGTQQGATDTNVTAPIKHEKVLRKVDGSTGPDRASNDGDIDVNAADRNVNISPDVEDVSTVETQPNDANVNINGSSTRTVNVDGADNVDGNMNVRVNHDNIQTDNNVNVTGVDAGDRNVDMGDFSRPITMNANDMSTQNVSVDSAQPNVSVDNTPVNVNAGDKQVNVTANTQAPNMDMNDFSKPITVNTSSDQVQPVTVQQAPANVTVDNGNGMSVNVAAPQPQQVNVTPQQQQVTVNQANNTTQNVMSNMGGVNVSGFQQASAPNITVQQPAQSVNVSGMNAPSGNGINHIDVSSHEHVTQNVNSNINSNIASRVAATVHSVTSGGGGINNVSAVISGGAPQTVVVPKVLPQNASPHDVVTVKNLVSERVRLERAKNTMSAGQSVVVEGHRYNSKSELSQAIAANKQAHNAILRAYAKQPAQTNSNNGAGAVRGFDRQQFIRDATKIAVASAAVSAGRKIVKDSIGASVPAPNPFDLMSNPTIKHVEMRKTEIDED